jgi:UPF0042 nucleotide-binding protein
MILSPSSSSAAFALHAPSGAKRRARATKTTSRRKTKRGRERVVLVTGLSGAGRSSALRTLEDLGYEALDNLPMPLLPNLLRPGDRPRRPLAIGVDIRTRDFAVGPLIRDLDRLARGRNVEIKLLFVDCEDEVLQRRFTETRRRHPLADDRPISDGIARERALMRRLRQRADVVIDTTNMKLADLKRAVEGHFAIARSPGLVIAVISFAYRDGIPREADLVIDARFLDNPHYVRALRALDGTDRKVAARVERDPAFQPFFAGLEAWLAPLLPRYEREGKSYLTIAIGCTGGRHRSVVVAEKLAVWLRSLGRPVTLRHRDVDRAQET